MRRAQDLSTPLHKAPQHGKVEVAALLIARGAAVDAVDKVSGPPRRTLLRS